MSNNDWTRIHEQALADVRRLQKIVGKKKTKKQKRREAAACRRAAKLHQGMP